MAQKREKENPGGFKNKRNDGKGRQDNREATKEDAEKMGFNFSKGGPPRFQNKKKEGEAAQQKNHDKDLRAVINEEKDKEEEVIHTYQTKENRQ